MSENPATIVEKLFAELGVEDRVTRVAPNVWTLAKGSATIQVVAAHDFVVATAKVADGVPQDGRERFLADLLRANQGMLGAFFTLENDGSVRVNQVLPIGWLQAPELGFVVGNVAKQADAWDDRLKPH
ncbi:MAG TPA: hypothetical protein VKE22_11435 [Haliangiales bacterium]|nr:hypothetical protein [Haliangiales bacterium]